MLTIDPGDINSVDWQQYLVGAVAPRPIAFVSSIDEKGIPNLAPYSYFNVFSSAPPILAFSAANKANKHDVKDTLKNVRTTREVVINVVCYHYVRQMVLTSVDFPGEVNEFEKSGLTPVPSDLVKPFRVAESPICFECQVKDIISLGENRGAGNIILCEVLRLHISEEILDINGRINPHKLDLMGRMGRAYYSRASGESIYTIYQSRNTLGIGYQSLPISARQSEILSANNLGHLASLAEIPDNDTLARFEQIETIHELIISGSPIKALHYFAKKELEKENLEEAAKAVWLAQRIFEENN